jgi:hypothetical protein
MLLTDEPTSVIEINWFDRQAQEDASDR